MNTYKKEHPDYFKVPYIFLRGECIKEIINHIKNLEEDDLADFLKINEWSDSEICKKYDEIFGE
jgi:hypothetical protein